MCERCAVITRTLLTKAFAVASTEAAKHGAPDTATTYRHLSEVIGAIDEQPTIEASSLRLVALLDGMSTPDLIRLGKALHYTYAVTDQLDDLCLAQLGVRAMNGDSDAQRHVDVVMGEMPPVPSFGGGGQPPMFS